MRSTKAGILGFSPPSRVSVGCSRLLPHHRYPREMLTFIVILLFFGKSLSIFIPSNSSLFPLSLNPEPPPLSPLTSPSHSFLKEILKEIAATERWDPRGAVRVSELDPKSVRVGGSQRYEFHVRVGRTVLMLKLFDGFVLWRKPEREWGGFGPDLDLDGAFDEDPKPAVRGLELEGPLDLRVAGGVRGDDNMSLDLPALNVTHGGLRRILVGDGITVKIEGARDVTVFHPYDVDILLDRSSFKANQDINQFWPLGHSSCSPLLSVRVVGLASIVAFRTRNYEAYVGTVFHTDDTIELLSEKCYNSGHFKQVPSWPFGSLSSKLAILVKALRIFLGNDVVHGRPARLMKAKITSSNLVKFRLKLERDITENDRIWESVAEWRTKPVVERVWFEIVARVEAGKGWKQMIVRKLTRPILSVESSPWSNLMSNISFTQIPSIVLPPEALTLDAHW